MTPILRYALIVTFSTITACSNQPTQTVEDKALDSNSPKDTLVEKKREDTLNKPAPKKVNIERKKNYHENGQLAYIITYKDNIKVSKESFTYYQTGELSIRSTSVNGLKHGLVKHFSRNGDIWRTESYKKGQKHGTSISYYSPKLIAKKSQYTEGLATGEHQSFLPNGKLSDKWLYQQGKLISHIKYEYFENGDLQFEQAYRNEKKNGLAKEYAMGKHLLTSTHYKGGLLDGQMLQFYPNGKVKLEKNYSANQLHGTSKGYFQNGELQWQTVYHQGLRQGLHKEYYQNGKLQKQVFYHNDQQNGIKRLFHENGQLKYELTMKNSKANGLLKEFDDEGNLKVTRHYNNGKITKESSSFLNGYLLWLSENEMEKLIN